VVPAPPEQVLAQLFSVSGADSYKPVMHSPGGMTLQKRKFPTWAIIVAIFFFPLGLLALLAKEENNVGIGIEPVQEGTRVTIQGAASPVLQSALQYVLAGYPAAPGALPQGVYPTPAAAYGQQPGYGQPGYAQPPEPGPGSPGWQPPSPPPPPPPA
jgi:hypothetical protein